MQLKDAIAIMYGEDVIVRVAKSHTEAGCPSPNKLKTNNTVCTENGSDNGEIVQQMWS